MTLDGGYLKYPERKHGQDIDRYPMRYVGEREKKSLPNGVQTGASIIVPLEYFMLNPSGAPFKHPGAMQTPYPDLRHYTTRDYGNRVGAFRLLKAFRQAGVKATFPLNAALLDRVRPLIDVIVEDGHEVAAHGWDTDSIHWGGIDPDTEIRYVSETREAFEKSGLQPRTWMSPARQQSFKTLDLIGASGFDICLDWEMDTVPVAMKTDHGHVTAFPVLNELDDRFILTGKNHCEAEWRNQIFEAASMMAEEAPRYGAQVFGFTMTPYIAGQPFRMTAVRDILARFTSDDRLTLNTVAELVDMLA